MKFDVEKHIVFRLEPELETKTNRFEVWNTQQDCEIGIVKWHPAWRHYCFFPHPDTVFSDRCLLKIGKFVEEENIRHKTSHKHGGKV
jgi:hypothetical protein